jgi:transposase
MGARGAHDPACPPWWAQTIGQRARGAERDFLHPMDRVSVEGVAQRPAAEEHGARLSGTVELGRHIGAHPPHALHRGAEQAGREASPTVAIIDSQTAKDAQKGGLGSNDAGKKIKGRKRHILVDTLGLLLNVVVHPADVQDRDGAFHLLRRARRLFPFIKRIFADGGYAGDKMARVVWCTGAWKLEIVKRSHAAGFEVLPKRWIVERTFAWISRNRRLARDFERYATTVAAFIRLAMIRIMLRRLAANASS